MTVRVNPDVICPACGWHGPLTQTDNGVCPRCEYEVNGGEPYRLMTLAELRESEHGATWCDVDMREFLRAVAEVEADNVKRQVAVSRRQTNSARERGPSCCSPPSACSACPTCGRSKPDWAEYCSEECRYEDETGHPGCEY